MYFEQKFDFFKTCKNPHVGPLRTTNPEYGGHNRDIQSFCQFFPQTWNFQENCRITPKNFEQKIDFFKT
jgi:hypothetical protein